MRQSVFLLVLVIGAMLSPPSAAREQEDGGLCWDPDIEFPVPCDEDDE